MGNKNKKKRKGSKKTGETTTIISESQENAVNLSTPQPKVGDFFYGSKVLRGNELWRWNDLSDVNY